MIAESKEYSTDWVEHHATSNRRCLVLRVEANTEVPLLGQEELNDLADLDVIIPPLRTRPADPRSFDRICEVRFSVALLLEHAGIRVLQADVNHRPDLSSKWFDVMDSKDEIIKVRAARGNALRYVCTDRLRHENIREETRRVIAESNHRMDLLVLARYRPGLSSLNNVLDEPNNVLERVNVLLDGLRGNIHMAEQKICHADVKPSNILVDRKNGHAMLADLEGVARYANETLGVHFGSQYYHDDSYYGVSRFDEARDSFAWGITILETLFNEAVGDFNNLLIGEKTNLNPRERFRLIMQIINGVDFRNSNLELIVRRCLDYRRGNRPRMQEIYEALQEYQRRLIESSD
jgi:hypothetical protein